MLQQERKVIEPLLDPGERLAEAASVSLAPGITRPPEELLTPRRPSRLEERIGSSFGVLRKAYAVLNPLQSAVGALEDRVQDVTSGSVVHGKGMDGGWSSAAGRFVVRMYDQGAYAHGLFAVTDRRVLMVVDRAKIWQLGTEDHTLHWSQPYAALAGLRRHPKGVIQRGRLDLVFADGSWAGVVTGLPRNAEPLAAAFARRGR
ncbi:hypothetical protein ABT095_27465 [Kitasatospora sp. NPDC002227]|uniref:hypothetical protein n=1 Tax=Kitasatospora sp. NPDC002227 TaxID=3154773 RepID=UPI0033190D2C